MATLDKFPRIYQQERRKFVKWSQNEKFRFVAFGHRRAKKEQQAKKLSASEENELRNFQMEPKQKILKMYHFPRMEKKFQ